MKKRSKKKTIANEFGLKEFMNDYLPYGIGLIVFLYLMDYLK